MTLGDFLKWVDIEKDKDKVLIFLDRVGDLCNLNRGVGKSGENIILFEDINAPTISADTMTNDLICPLLNEPCIRDKCVCYSTRDYDNLEQSCKPYGVCEHLRINLDYEKGGSET